jgi:RNA polymerase sigma-70 factor, ECF subfamily
MSPSDTELIQRVLAGDRDSYAWLVRRYQEMLYRHALGMVSDGDAAADLVQDSFIKAFSSLESCHDPERFGAWVFRILRNRCHDYLRDRRRQSVSLDEAVLVTASAENPHSHFDRVTLGQALERALARLPEPQREAFLLKHVEGCSYDEMTEMLGASISALKMRVLRAREALQAQLADRIEQEP